MDAREADIAERYRLISGELDERQRRIWAAVEARSFGRGGIAATARACELAENTVRNGLRDLDTYQRPPEGKVRRPGAGRKRVEEGDPSLLDDLAAVLTDGTRGDPERPLLWSSKSLRNLADALNEKTHRVDFRTIPRLLAKLGYTLQANRKAREGSNHPDRDSQFRHINGVAEAAIAAQEPVISVDTKKKELVGSFKNGGREWRPQGTPIEVNTHDFPSYAEGKAVPYGVYDPAANEGFVSVGITADTAQFSVASIEAWWRQLGRERYPEATTLTITADCGGSNGYRTRLWKTELQRLADETGLQITVCHLPPGTSKWNKVEHRLFSFISANWRGRPLTSHQVVVNLIAATKTNAGLKVYARLDQRDYPKAVKVSDEQLGAVNLTGDEFHPEWNYTIKPSGC